MPKRERVVKSVLFSDGMGDGSDRFLLEPPAVDYAENLRIDKQGSLQKRPGFESLGTPSGATGTPFALSSFNDRLFALTKTGAFAYDGSWSTVTNDTFIGQKEVAAQSPLERGLNHVNCQPYVVNGEVTGYTVAYEVRASATSDLQSTERKDKYVVIQWYTKEGKPQTTLRVDGAQNPKIVVNGLIHYVAYHRPQSQDIRLRSVIPGQISTTDIVLDTPPVTQTNPLISHGSFAAIRSGRLGEVLEGNAHFHLAMNDTDVFVLSTEHDTGTNVSNVWLTRCTILSGAQVPGQLRQLHQRTGVTAGCIALDVQLSLSGAQYVHCLYAADEEALAAQVNARLYWQSAGQTNINTAFVSETSLLLGDYTIIDAKIAQDPANVLLPTVVYQHGGSPTNYYERADANFLFNFLGARPPNNAVEWREFDLLTPAWDTSVNRLYHHRMTTRPLIAQNGDLLVGVQQWADYTPFGPTTSMDDWDEFVQLGPARKPVTTALARLDRSYSGSGNARATPIATLDAGRSAHTDPVDAMLVTHATQLLEIGTSYYATNRVITEAADVTMYFSNAKYSVGPNPATRTGAVEAGARAYINMHKITPGTVRAELLGDGIVIASAMPIWFDGENFGELSPLETPEIIRIADTYHWNNNAEAELVYAPDPGHGGASDYRAVRVIVGYADANGNIHRSAPSTTLWVNRITTGQAQATNQKLTYLGKEVDITFTAPLTGLSRQRDYFVEVYVSNGEDDDPVLAHTQTLPASTTGDLANYTVTAQLIRMIPEDDDSGNPPTSWDNDRQAKLPVRSTAPVYTSGGALAADPWPAAQLVTSTSTRLWAVDAENKGRVVYSKLFEDYIAPEYNPTLAINLGDERNLTAIGKLDDKVVVFEPNDIHVIYGDGPDNRGQGQEFAVHYIATDVGCTDQESVIETPIGLMFYSKPRGFYLLDRNMQVQFIGEGIEDTAAGIDIVSAQLVRDKAEVRIIYTGGPASTDRFGPTRGTTAIDRPPTPVFTNVGGFAPALTYNYERNAWLTYTNYDAAAATIYQGKYTMLRNNWEVWQESGTRWDDPANVNLTVLTTPWIKLSEQVQGFVALWKIRVLGRYLSSLQDLGGGVYEAGDLRILVYYDYETTATQIKDYRVQDFGYDPFNNPPKRAERFQFEFEPKRGHCQAVKFKFSERVSESMGEPITYGQGRGFEITAVDLEMGVARQQALLPQAVRK